MKNKKSLMIVEALVIIIAFIAIFFLIIIPACNKARAIFFNAGPQSFETFVNGINKMALDPGYEGTEQFILQLNDKSAVVGFSSAATRYECYNCYVGTANPRATIVFNKPANSECTGSACACLCDGNFKLEGDNPKIGKCMDDKPICKKLNINIVSKTIIKKYGDLTQPVLPAEYWDNSFLFARGVAGANDLKLYSEELMTLYVQKKGWEIGVCDGDMMDFNKIKLKQLDGSMVLEGTCINNNLK